MAMLKDHEEDDASFMSRVQHAMEAIYDSFASRQAFVEYFQKHWGTIDKLSECLYLLNAEVPAFFDC